MEGASMGLGPFITEDQLREQYSLGHGTEIHLPRGCRLTPSARGLLEDRRIIIKYVDEEGRTFVSSTGDTLEAKEEELKQVNPLTSSDEWSSGSCLMCHQTLKEKPEVLTHIDFQSLVLKTDPRLKFRGKLDTLIGQAVLLQIEVKIEGAFGAQMSKWLEDIRSILGNLLKAEATNSEMANVSLGDMDEKMIHALSHNPLKYLGHDHLMPDASQGRNVALLNVLRGQVREAELLAADIYITRDFKVMRPDIMAAINRLSSALYVLMILTYMAERGKTVNLGNIQV